MRFPIEVESPLKVGSVIDVMRLELAIITLVLLRKSYVPTTLTLILDPVSMKPTTLQISYDYLPELIKGLVTLSLTVKSHHINEISNGESTPE